VNLFSILPRPPASPFLGFLDHTHTDTPLISSGRVISPSQRPLPTQGNTTYKHNRQTSMPRAGFEPATPATKRPQTYALDRAAWLTISSFKYHLYSKSTWDKTESRERHQGTKLVFPMMSVQVSYFYKWVSSKRHLIDHCHLINSRTVFFTQHNILASAT
jgi:hypothetical protein